MENLKTKWLEALRSGKYKQGTLALKTVGERFCCLGVLADIHPDYKWVEKKYDFDDEPFFDAVTRDYECHEVLSSTLIPGDVQEKLARLNDNDRWSFDEIAEYIEEHASEDLKEWS